MKRTEKLTTSVTPAEKKEFKKLAVELEYETPAAMLRALVYEHLDDHGKKTSEQDVDGGNPNRATADQSCNSSLSSKSTAAGHK